MGLFKPLPARDAQKVLGIAKQMLKKGLPADARGGALRAAIASALKQEGWWRSGYGSDRERVIAVEVGRANNLKGSSAHEVEDWSRNKSTDELVALLDKTIAYLK